MEYNIGKSKLNFETKANVHVHVHGTIEGLVLRHVHTITHQILKNSLR